MTEDNSGVSEQVAEAQQMEAQQAQPDQSSDKEINFRALRDKVDNLERHNQFLQTRIFQDEQSREQKQNNGFDLSSTRDDDIPTYGELKKILASQQEQQRRYDEKLQQMEVRSKYKDYGETINKYLPDVLNDDPDLAAAIKDNPQMHKLAYKLAQASPRYHQDRMSQENNNAAAKMAENSSRPQPAMARKNVAINDDDARYSSMTDEQLWSVFNMAKARS